MPSAGTASPTRLDCNLTTLETRAGKQFDSGVESRSITVVFDQETNALILYQEGSSRLDNVSMSVASINGAAGNVTLGIDRSSWGIVLQTKKTDSTIAEFGACGLSTKPPP
jgi:hypothetical protein